MTDTTEMYENAIKKMLEQAAILLDEESPRIRRAMDDAAVVAS